jgi:hypothetical protein
MPVCAARFGLELFRCLVADPACFPPLYEPHLADIAAVAEQESGFHPWALRDEATGESLFMANRALLAREIEARLQAGHTLGVGMFQITGRANWQRHGLDTIEVLTDPCRNMRAGVAHWADDFKAAADQRYNSGRFNGAPGYAAQVAARRVRLLPLLAAPSTPAPALEPAGQPASRSTAFARTGRPSAFERARSAPSPRPPIEAGGPGSPQRLADRN